MPRLHGYRERIWTNLYDNVFYGTEHPAEPYGRLFEHKNIGNRTLTNIYTAGCLHDDNTMIVVNWYARTNITMLDERLALLAVANDIRCNLIVGMKPYYDTSLAELLGRKPEIDFPPDEKVDALTYFAEARKRKIDEISKATDVRPSHVAAVLDHVKYPQRAVLIPVRQSYSVRVDVPNLVVLNDFVAHLDARNHPTADVGDGPYRTPGDVARVRPAVWIHLEGWLTRDVQ